MGFVIFQIVVGIFTLAVAWVFTIVFWRVIKESLLERRQERERADALIDAMTPEMREQLKRVRGGKMRRHILRWEKQSRMPQ